MRVLLTGGSGFIGRHVVDKLLENNVECVTLGRVKQHGKIPHVTFDLLRDDDFRHLLEEVKPSHLVHLAWCTEHGTYWESQDNLKWMNATYRLIDCFYKLDGDHAFIAGTCAEYDWRYGYCDEELTPCNPTTLYGVAKDATRRSCQLLANRYGRTLTWGRFFFTFGFGENPARLIPSLIRAFRGEIKPFGVNEGYVRDFLYVEDLADAVCLCIQQKVNGVVNLSSGNPISLREIVEFIAELEGKSPCLIFNEQAAKRNEPKMIVGKNKKLGTLGWSAKKSFPAALAML